MGGWLDAGILVVSCSTQILLKVKRGERMQRQNLFVVFLSGHVMFVMFVLFVMFVMFMSG